MPFCIGFNICIKTKIQARLLGSHFSFMFQRSPPSILADANITYHPHGIQTLGAQGACLDEERLDIFVLNLLQ